MRPVTTSMFRAVLALGLTLSWGCSQADVPAKYVIDQHFKAVRLPVAATSGKVEVMEVFSYSCSHCFNFEPMVEKWLKTKPADVVFVQQPWSLGQPAALPRSKAAVAARQLGVYEKFHKALFGAIHGQGKVMATNADLEELFVSSTGLDVQQFRDAFNGFAADSEVRRGENLVRDFGLSSVPTVVVDGRWYTNGSMAGGNDKVFAVVDFLVSQAKSARKAK